MIKFKELFSFKKQEIRRAFEHARLHAKKPGLKLLQAPAATDFGKLLIVIPRLSGKANIRNLLRRRVKAIFYEEQLHKKPVISILIVYAEAMKLNFDQIKAFLIKQLT